MRWIGKNIWWLLCTVVLCGMAVLFGGLIWVDVRRRRKECGNET